MSRERDLFGQEDRRPPVANPNGLVRVALDCCARRSTEKAWFLTKAGQREGHHVPRSLAVRGDGPNINTWTMPRWMASENGWL